MLFHNHTGKTDTNAQRCCSFQAIICTHLPETDPNNQAPTPGGDRHRTNAGALVGATSTSTSFSTSLSTTRARSHTRFTRSFFVMAPNYPAQHSLAPVAVQAKSDRPQKHEQDVATLQHLVFRRRQNAMCWDILELCKLAARSPWLN